MPFPGHLQGARWDGIRNGCGALFGPPGLAHRVRQRFKVIATWTQSIWIGLKSDHFPPPRSSKTLAVGLTKVVTVWFCVGRQWSQNSGAV